MITRKSRQTGLMVTVASADEMALDEGPECKWYTVCDSHGQATGHATKKLAVYFAADPLTWCEICNGNDTMDEG